MSVTPEQAQEALQSLCSYAMNYAFGTDAETTVGKLRRIVAEALAPSPASEGPMCQCPYPAYRLTRNCVGCGRPIADAAQPKAPSNISLPPGVEPKLFHGVELGRSEGSSYAVLGEPKAPSPSDRDWEQGGSPLGEVDEAFGADGKPVRYEQPRPQTKS